MAAKSPASLRFGTEGTGTSVVCFTLSSVSNNDTTVIPGLVSIVSLEATPSTSAGVGFTSSLSGGVLTVTWLISTGTPNLTVRVAGDA